MLPEEYRGEIGNAIKSAFSRSLPVLSVKGLEVFGMARRYKEYLMTTPAGLGRRSQAHGWFFSPWQTLPVDVDGMASVCDCRPHASLGSLLDQSFSNVWNGPRMQKHRRRMLSEAPPADCRACPRF